MADAAGVALSPASVIFVDVAGEPVVPPATLTVASMFGRAPTPMGVAAAAVQVRVSLATVVVDSAQL